MMMFNSKIAFLLAHCQSIFDAKHLAARSCHSAQLYGYGHRSSSRMTNFKVGHRYDGNFVRIRISFPVCSSRPSWLLNSGIAKNNCMQERVTQQPAAWMWTKSARLW